MKECSEYIKATDRTANIFVISGLLENRNKYDYGRMKKTLITSFPAYKRQALLTSKTIASKEVIRAKVKLLKSQAWMIGILSGGITGIAVPDVSLVLDYMLISETKSNYKNQLGLDDASLKRLARCHNLSFDEIHKKLTGGWLGALVKNNIRNFMTSEIQKTLAANLVDKFIKFIPIVGLLAEMFRTAITTVTILHKSLNETLAAAYCIVDLTK